METSIQRIKRRQAWIRGLKQRHSYMLRCMVPELVKLDSSLVVELKKEMNCLKLSIATPLSWQRLCRKFKTMPRKAMCRDWMVVVYRYDLRTQHLTLFSKGAGRLWRSNGVWRCTENLGKTNWTLSKWHSSMMRYKLKQRRQMQNKQHR